MLKKGITIVFAALWIAIGVAILNACGLIVGGTVGLGLLLHYIMHKSASEIIFILNLPFYLLSLYCLGFRFTVKTVLAVTSLSLFSSFVLPHIHMTTSVNPIIGAIVGGVFVGVGIAILVRRQSSIGGITVLATYLSKKYRIKFQYTMMSFDILILLFSLTLFSINIVICSSITVLITNLILSKKNHVKTQS
jgi:uncharacterized membrane-anchored protein YitT (DUF2179 family)